MSFFFFISYKLSHFIAAVLQNRLWKCGWSCQTHQHLLDQRISVYLLLHSVPASILGRGPVSHLTLWLRVQDFWSQIFNPRSNFSNCAITYCKERGEGERESCHMVFTTADRTKCHQAAVTRSAAVLRLKIKFHSLCEEEEREKKKKFRVDEWAACWIYFPWFSNSLLMVIVWKWDPAAVKTERLNFSPL